MKKQIFLGGACGTTTWRRDIAIPALEAANITYHNPQLGIGEWTTDNEAEEMRAKDEADVLLFVIDDHTRGVASVAEVAYLLAARRPLALAVTDIHKGSRVGDQIIDSTESDDLNRGRIFIRTMAAEQGVPIFQEVESAVRYAIELIGTSKSDLSLADVKSVLADIVFKNHQFNVETVSDGFQLQLSCDEVDLSNGEPSLQFGRKWHVGKRAGKSEIVQTAFKAVVTWMEHDAREHFRYKGAQVFGPHFEIDDLERLCNKNR